RGPDHDPPGRHVDVAHDLRDRRDQMLALRALHDPEILTGALFDPRDATDVATVFRGHPGTLELPGIEAARLRRQRLGGRHRDQPADEGPRRLWRFHALEGQEDGVALAARGGHAP